MNYAIIKDGYVINVVIWDGGNDWSPPEGAVASAINDGDFVDTGYIYRNGAFAPPSAF